MPTGAGPGEGLPDPHAAATASPSAPMVISAARGRAGLAVEFLLLPTSSAHSTVHWSGSAQCASTPTNPPSRPRGEPRQRARLRSGDEDQQTSTGDGQQPGDREAYGIRWRSGVERGEEPDAGQEQAADRDQKSTGPH